MTVTSQHKLSTIAHVNVLYQPLRGRFAEQLGGDNINYSQNIGSPIRGRQERGSYLQSAPLIRSINVYNDKT